MSRSFYITRCDVCGNVNGSIEKRSDYNPTRDLEQWASEDRFVTIYTQEKLGKFPDWCHCDITEVDGDEEE